MRSPYEAHQQREAAATPRIQLLLDAADKAVVDPRRAEPFTIYPGNVAGAAGIEPFTYQELRFAVQQMQAAGWVATLHSDQRDGDYISLQSPSVPKESYPPHFRIPGRD